MVKSQVQGLGDHLNKTTTCTDEGRVNKNPLWGICKVGKYKIFLTKAGILRTLLRLIASGSD